MRGPASAASEKTCTTNSACIRPGRIWRRMSLSGGYRRRHLDRRRHEFSEACAIYRSDRASQNHPTVEALWRRRSCCGKARLLPRAFSLIVRDESHRLFLGGLLSSRARLRFTGCLDFAMKEVCWSRSFHRAAMSELTGCLRPGVHPSFSGAVMAFVSTSVSITSIRSRRSGARRQL